MPVLSSAARKTKTWLDEWRLAYRHISVSLFCFNSDSECLEVLTGTAPINVLLAHLCNRYAGHKTWFVAPENTSLASSRGESGMEITWVNKTEAYKVAESQP